MEIFFKVAQYSLFILISLKYWKYKCQFIGLVAYMVEYRLQMPNKKQIREYTIYAEKSLLKMKH